MMAVKLKYFIWTVFLAIFLTSCATGDPSDDFSFDYSSAEIGDFNGTWIGRVDCGYSSTHTPRARVNIENGVGKLSLAYGDSFISSELNLQNGTIRWQGSIKATDAGDKLPVSFKGYWRQGKLKLKGRIQSNSCSGVIYNY